jgi:hypothetical protein
MSHLSWHLAVPSLAVMLMYSLRLRLAVSVLTGLRGLQMAPELLGAQTEETCVLIVYIRSTL